MRWRYILNVVGILTLFFGLTMLFPIAVAFYYKDQSVIPFLKSIGITTFAGLLLHLCFRGSRVEIITQREGMAIVSIGWITIGIFGALPFYLGGEFITFVDAFFESVSGVTTTGASVLTNIEAVSKGLLFLAQFYSVAWRNGNNSFIHCHTPLFRRWRHAAL